MCFKRSKFSIESEVNVPILENSDAIRNMILSDRWIGLKQISETLNSWY